MFHFKTINELETPWIKLNKTEISIIDIEGRKDDIERKMEDKEGREQW